MDSMASVRAVLVEDDSLFRSLLSIGLTQSGRVEVVGDYADGESALAAVPSLRPDVAVLDFALRTSLNGVQLGRLLRQRLPGLGIVLLSSHRIPAFLSAVPRDEIAGWSYLLKSSVEDVETLIRAVEGAAAGQVMVDPDLLTSLPRPDQGRLDRLTARQLNILRLMAMGFSNQTIAEQIHVTRKTVENQINELFPQLGIDPTDPTLQPRVQAVLIYLQENGLL